MRPRKYNTPEEKRESLNRNCREWYQKHKNDPSFKKLTQYRYEKYKKGLPESKEEFLKSYNTDYVYYIRMVRTGKFQKKIEKAEQNANIMSENIKMMKARLNYLIKKFGHLEKKKEDKIEENTDNVNQE